MHILFHVYFMNNFEHINTFKYIPKNFKKNNPQQQCKSSSISRENCVLGNTAQDTHTQFTQTLGVKPMTFGVTSGMMDSYRNLTDSFGLGNLSQIILRFTVFGQFTADCHSERFF